MHRDLQLRNLDRLPASIRRVASLAASDTRTFAQVQHARELMETPTLSSSQRLVFLAVFFPALDPARILRLEDFSVESKEDIACANVALDAMFHLRTQGAIGLSLWPRVWPWVNFIHTHWQDLEDQMDFLPERSFYINLTLFVGAFFAIDHQATRELISTTPGFWACIVKSWTFLTQLDSPVQRFVVLSYLSGILANSGVRSHPERLEEMIDAAGSIGDFAGLVEDLIRTVVTHYTSDNRSPLAHVEYLMIFLDDADQFPEDQAHTPMLVPLGSLGVALYEYSDFVGELVAAILLLCDRPEREAGSAMDQCLLFIWRMVMTTPATFWLSNLLERGLLRALILITLRCDARGWELENQVRYFLDLILPGGLVYFPAVLAYRDALRELQDLLLGDDFKQTVPVLYETWQRFFAVAEERCEALAKYQSPPRHRLKACDNQEVCCELSPIRHFTYSTTSVWLDEGISLSQAMLRLSGVLLLLLGHQNACRTHNSLLLSERVGLNFTDRPFLRALIHHKYLKEQRSICAQQIQVLAEYDSAVCIPNVLFTLFNYCKTSPIVTVYPINMDVVSEARERSDDEAEETSDDEAEETSDDEDMSTPEQLHELVDMEADEWEDLLEWAKLGEGRYQLHGIRIMDGVRLRTWVVPLRTDGDELFTGLVKLSQRMRRGSLAEADLMGEIDLLLKSTEDIVEIH